jgi:hypothetical protein
MKKLLSILLLLIVPIRVYADVIDPIQKPADSTQYIFFIVLFSVAIIITVISVIIKNKKGK